MDLPKAAARASEVAVPESDEPELGYELGVLFALARSPSIPFASVPQILQPVVLPSE